MNEKERKKEKKKERKKERKSETTLNDWKKCVCVCVD